MRFEKIVAILALSLLAACGTRSSGSVSPVAGAASLPPVAAHVAKPASEIIVTEGDITDRRYRAVGDIQVSVSKWTIFDADPTKEKIDEALRERAAELGADAVVLARYGTVGLGLFTYGTRDGNGRAVIFEK